MKTTKHNPVMRDSGISTALGAATLIAAIFLSLALPAQAANYTYSTDANANWATFVTSPAVAGDAVTLSADLTAARTITLTRSDTLGSLSMVDTGNTTTFAWTLTGAGQTLTFDTTTTSVPATLTAYTSGAYNSNSMTVSVSSIVLNKNLNINVADMGTNLTINGTTFSANNNSINMIGSGGLTLGTLGTTRITDLTGFSTGLSMRTIVINSSVTTSGNYTLNLRNVGDFQQTGAMTLSSGSLIVNAGNVGRAYIAGSISATNLTLNGMGAQNWGNDSNGATYIGNSVFHASMLKLGGNNTFTGTTTINGAELYLDNTSTNGSKISSSGVLTLNNGLVYMQGSTTANSTQAVGSTTVASRSGNQIAVNKQGGVFTTTFNAGLISPGQESWLNFYTATTAGTASIAISNSNDATGILGPWATVANAKVSGGSDQMGWAAVSGGLVTTASQTTMTNTGTSSPNVNFVFVPTMVNANQLGTGTLGGNVSANTLKILTTGNGGNYHNTISLSANTISLSSGGLILTSNASNGASSTMPLSLWPLNGNDNNTKSIHLKGTGTISAATGAPLYIYTNLPTWIDNPVVGDVNARLVKGGFNTLFLSAASTMAGITVDGGEVALTGNATLPTGNLSLANGGGLLMGGTLTRAIGTGSNQVYIGAGGGGFGGMGASGLTLNLTGSGAGGALTKADVGGNLVLSNVHSATGVTTLTSNVDTTGDIVLSSTRAAGSIAQGSYSNDGAAYAVVTGATSGNGALTLLGPNNFQTFGGNVNSNGGGLIYLKGALGHTGGLTVVGTGLYLGNENSSYLSGINLNLSGGAALAAHGSNNYTVGNGNGQISFSAANAVLANNESNDSGGFAAVGGANTVTLNGGAALDFFDSGNNPYRFAGLVLGSALSTHELTLTNNMTSSAGAGTVQLNVFGPQLIRVTGNILNGVTGSTSVVIGAGSSSAGFGKALLSGTGSNYQGNLSVADGFVAQIGDVSAFGAAGSTKTISVASNAGLDLNGISDLSTTHTWSIQQGSGTTYIANIFNSSTVAATIAGQVNSGTFANSGGNIGVGGPGDIIFTGTFSGDSSVSASSFSFRGTGTYTFQGGYLQQASNTLSRSTGIYGGATVVFDNTVTNYSTGGTVRLLTNNSAAASTSASLQGGSTFRLLGSNTANTQQDGVGRGIDLQYAGNTIEVRSGTGSFTTTLNSGLLTRSNQGTVNLVETNQGSGVASITTTTTNSSAGILGSWATYNGNTYAANDGSNNVIGFNSYNTTTFNGAVTDVTATSNSISANLSGMAMRFNSNAAPTVTLTGSATLTATANPYGILVTSNVTNGTLITGGIINIGEIDVHQYNTNAALTISSQLTW